MRTGERRMITKRFILLTLVSIAVLVGWLFSYQKPISWRWAEMHWEGGTLRIRLRGVEISNGQVWTDWARLGVSVPPANARRVEESWRKRFPAYQRFTPTARGWMPGTSIGGLGFYRRQNRAWEIWGIGVPFWFPAVVCMIFPLRVVLRRWVTADRRRRGLCPTCGYDLRANAGRCPECGTIPDARALAPECGPAVVAMARSSGTKAVVLLALYMIAACFTIAFFVESFAGHPSEAAPAAYIAGFGGAMALVLLGARHAANYSRSTEAFFGFGCLGGLLLGPAYIWLGRYTSPAVQASLSMICIIAIGALARMIAVRRWRCQDRAPLSLAQS